MERVITEKVCPKCKKKFSCMAAQSGCWCEKHQLIEKTLQLLRERYNDCLCEECLRAFAS